MSLFQFFQLPGVAPFASPAMFNPPAPPFNGRAPGAVGAHRRIAAKVRNRRRHKRTCGMRGRSRR